MSLIIILACIFILLSLVGLGTWYGVLFHGLSAELTPQFQGVLGSTVVGSVILVVLAYLSLVQQDPDVKLYIPIVLTGVSIVVASVAIAVGTLTLERTS